jgi:hypothetical protein
MSMMNKVQFLLAAEPCKPLKPLSLYVVFLVEKDVGPGRCRTCDYLNHKEINWQYEVCAGSHQNQGNEEEGRVVALVTEIRPGDEMVFGIVDVMEVDVITEKSAAHSMMAKLIVHQCLSK